MTKQHFIALADMVKFANNSSYAPDCRFSDNQIKLLAQFCQEQNPAFNRERWMDYIAGKCGSNGGKVKTNNLKTAGR